MGFISKGALHPGKSNVQMIPPPPLTPEVFLQP
jgi:hypothetical protein